MPTHPPVTVALNRKREVIIRLFASNGDEDTSSPLVVQSPQPAFATITVDPLNPRKVFIAGGTQEGSINMTVNANPVVPDDPGDPNDGAVIIPVTSTAPANLRRIEVVTMGPEIPK